MTDGSMCSADRQRVEIYELCPLNIAGECYVYVMSQRLVYSLYQISVVQFFAVIFALVDSEKLQ